MKDDTSLYDIISSICRVPKELILLALCDVRETHTLLNSQ